MGFLFRSETKRLGEHKPGRIKPGRIKRAALSLQNQNYYMFICLIRPRLYASETRTHCFARRETFFAAAYSIVYYNNLWYIIVDDGILCYIRLEHSIV